MGLGLPEESIDEISVYFNESWGNRTRIDYGSGMELNFLCWLYVSNLPYCVRTELDQVLSREIGCPAAERSQSNCCQGILAVSSTSCRGPYGS